MFIKLKLFTKKFLKFDKKLILISLNSNHIFKGSLLKFTRLVEYNIPLESKLLLISINSFLNSHGHFVIHSASQFIRSLFLHLFIQLFI